MALLSLWRIWRRQYPRQSVRKIDALDTNVLVRYLVRDNAEQAEASRILLESLSPERPGFVCREVMLEVVWVLERAYHLSRDQIAIIVEELTHTEGLVIEADDDVIRAAMGYRQGIADFSDFMILIAAQRAGAEPLYTFDRKFSRLARTELLDAIHKDDSQ